MEKKLIHDSDVQRTNLDKLAGTTSPVITGVPTRRRIGGSYANLFYAGGTLMDLMTALGALRATIDFAKTAVAARDDHKVAEAEQRLTRVLIDVQNVCLELQQKLSASADAERAGKDRIHDLEQKVRDLEAKAAERAKYVLAEPYPGTFVLELKERSGSEEPFHRLCQGCMDNLGKKVVLQGGPALVICPKCDHRYRIADTPPSGGTAARLARGRAGSV